MITKVTMNIAAVIGLAHGGVDTDFGGDAADQQILDAVFLQQIVERGRVERAFAGLVDHDRVFCGVELRDDVVAGFAADQNPSHRARIADPHARRTARDLRRRRIGEIGQVPFAGVHHENSGVTCSLQHVGAGLDRTGRLRDIVAECLAEAAVLEEIALHVDNDERGCGPVKFDRTGLRGEQACAGLIEARHD
jgi:hypothetical protein